MAHGSSPRHSRKPRTTRAQKPGSAAKKAPGGSPAAPARTAGASAPPSGGGAQRLQKLLAAAGFGSRRDVEQFLVEERVTVNGRVAKLGSRADPFVDEIRVDGEKLARERPAYWIVHKPRGVITTVRDDAGRRTVMDLLPRAVGRLFPVGRLDLDTSGLLLLTNDGDLAHALLHPSLGNEREYRVNVRGQLDAKAIGRLERGVSLEEGRTASAKVSDVAYDPDSRTTSLSLTLIEGKKRQIRRSLLVLGFPVRRLVRVRMGPLRIGRLAVGEARPLRSEERRALMEHVRRLRAGEPVAAAARSGAGREDVARPPRRPSARRGRGVSPTRSRKAGESSSPKRAPKAGDAASPKRSPRGGEAASPKRARGAKAPPTGPRAAVGGAKRSGSGPRGPAAHRKSATGDGASPGRPRGPKAGSRAERSPSERSRKKVAAKRSGSGRAKSASKTGKAPAKTAGARGRPKSRPTGGQKASGRKPTGAGGTRRGPQRGARKGGGARRT